MSSTELLSLVEQYKAAQQLIEAAQAEMARREVERMDVGTHKVTLKTVTTSRLAARFIKTTTATRFCVA